MNIPRLIEQYKREKQCKLQIMLDYFQNLDLEQAIERAALAKKPDGKKYRHQWRIRTRVLKKAAKRLKGAKTEIGRCKSFDALIRIVEEKTRNVKGFGPLAVYDTTLRIAAHQPALPSKVYFHAGTRKGCRALEMSFGINCKEKTLETRFFPSAIRKLKAHEIEDFLCIYKKYLAGKRGLSPSVCD